MRRNDLVRSPVFCHQVGCQSRHGNILVLTAVFLVGFCAMVAFAVDVGYMLLVRTELQRSADAAALAAAQELAGDTTDPYRLTGARQVAADYAAFNKIVGNSPAIDPNPSNNLNGDVVIGYAANRGDRPIVLDTSDPELYNAVRVRVKRTSTQNGEVPLFFGQVLGQQSFSAEAVATAAIWRDIEGFRRPPRNVSIPILPVTLNATDWKDMMDGTTQADDFAWDQELKEVVSGGDSVPEVELYAEPNGSGGNFGTVRIGRANNSTSHLSDQILNGMTAEDMEYHGGELTFDDDGYLPLSGEPGVSASIRNDFEQIVGQTRVIPIYDQVVLNGSTALYRIVQFVGIRVVDVQLNGAHLRIIVQPADISIPGGVPSDEEEHSEFVYTMVQLIE
jgi:Flp pilus assembly protein TadG